MTEVVYVCSPDRRKQILPSLDSLLGSRSEIDRIRILLVGRKEKQWDFRDRRIHVESVAPLFGDYFFGNKLYLCDSPSSRVVFLDTDTIILRPLQEIWTGNDSDLLARVGDSYGGAGWDSAEWARTCERLGAGTVPMFNAGLLVFQNGSHRRIAPAWRRVLHEYLKGSIPAPFHDARMFEQFALALAVGLERIRYSALDSSAHAYGWQREDYTGSVVLHTSTPRFETSVWKVRNDPATAWALFPRVGRSPEILTRRARYLAIRLRTLIRRALGRRLTSH